MAIGIFNKSFKNLSWFFMFTAFMAVTASPALGGLPEAANLNLNQISFIPNQGQIDQEVLFYHQGPRNHIFFTKTKMALLSSTEEGTRAVELIPQKMQDQCRVVGAERLAGRVTYLKGDPSQWKKDLPTYAGVVYQDVWPGIDLKFYAVGSQVEYDLMVAPGADPKAIQFALGGGERLELGPQGELIVSVDGQPLVVQKKPVAYQELDGMRREVEARFVLGDSSYGLNVADYDRTRPLVIDPLVFSMFVGGTGDDSLFGLVIDPDGYIYVAGSSRSSDYPVTASRPYGGSSDCVITRFAPDGQSIAHSTYLGGDKEDGCGRIAIRSDREVIVAGYSQGGTFPVSASGVYDSTHGGGDNSDIFVARLSYDLNTLRWATYVGGYEKDMYSGLDLDGSDNIYVIGYTLSYGTAPFPTTAGAYQTALNGWRDVVVFRLKNDGTALDFSTYLGGSDGDYSLSQGDIGGGIAVTGNAVYIMGTAYSADFPTEGFNPDASLGGASDIFYGRLTLTGTPLLLSLLGGSSKEVAYGLALAPAGDYFVLTGYTWSSDFPNLDGYDTSPNGQTDAFVAGIKIFNNAFGWVDTSQFATLLGGGNNDSGQAVAIGDDGTIFVGGNTASSNFPVKKAVDTSFNGGAYDLFITKLSADASALLWSTYLGGSDMDYFTALAIDQSGAAIGIGYTGSDDFPVAKYPNNMGEFNGVDDGFLFKLTPKIVSTAPLSILLTDD